MKAKAVSSAFTTEKVQETKAFYQEYLGATVTFDCGWYINLSFGNEAATLQFMSPQLPEHQLSNSAGLIYNFKVDNVDQEYNRLNKANQTIVIPLEDHPWGDRGFGIKDPNGITVYIYTVIEPTEDFKKYYLDT